MNGSLPEHWAEVSIREIADINPPPDRCPVDGNVEVTFLGMSSVLPEHRGISEPATRPYHEVSKGYTRFVERDVLFAKITPCMENGKVVVAEPLTNTVGCGSTEFHVLRARHGVDPGWLSRFLWRSDIRHLAKGQMTGGVGQQRVPTSFFENLTIPVAPTHEQTRIVDCLDKTLAKIDEAQESLERVRKNLERYRSSVLKAACEGRLVPNEADLARRERRTYESATKLLKRILAARREAWEKAQLAGYQKKGATPPKEWQARYPEPIAPDASNLPELPEGWCWATIDQLCSRITSGSRDWSPYYGTGPGVFVMAQNVRMGRFDLWTTQLVNPPTDNRDRDRSLIQKDDLLVTIVGAKTGDVCRVDVELEEHFVCQSVALLRPALATTARYLETFLISQSGGQAHFRKFTYGQGRPHLGFDQLQAVIVPLPPALEQEVINEEVERIVSSLSKVQETSVSQIRHCHILRQSLLKHAFSGKLVQQDPADEPAAVLLERIRDQRKEQTAAVKHSTSRNKKTPTAKANKSATARRKRAPGKHASSGKD